MLLCPRNHEGRKNPEGTNTHGTCGVRCGLWWRGGPPQKKTLELLFGGGGGAGRRIRRRRRKLRPPSKKETRPLPLGMLLSFFVFASSKCVCVCVVLLLLLLVHYNMFLFCFISSYTEKCVWGGGVSHSAATGVVTIGRIVCLLTRADMARNYFRLKRSKTI